MRVSLPEKAVIRVENVLPLMSREQSLAAMKRKYPHL